MPQNINAILKEVIEKIEPEKAEISKIKNLLEDFLKKIKASIRKNRIFAEAFVGGSYAKGTLIKKGQYDIDIFIRFHKDYKNEHISALAEKILNDIKIRKQKIHGSRDYFRAEIEKGIFFEIIPVKKISNPKEAENITDLSYFHVNYINKKIKNEKIRNEIRLAKAFCHANNCYGAESYVSGFSGYGLELLIYHYKTFLNFIKAMIKVDNKNKLIIDIERYYKNKTRVLLDINSAKLQSPIILIDPTYKQRNVLAALSTEIFHGFQEACRRFLQNPSTKAFEPKKLDFNAIKENAEGKGYEFVFLEASTDRQEGDIAGSKLLKFYNYVAEEAEKFFEIKARGFQYEKGKTARFFFVASKVKEVLVQGPLLSQEEHARKFRKKYGKLFIKNNRLYAKYKTSLSLRKFLLNWKQKYERQIKDMAIKELKIG